MPGGWTRVLDEQFWDLAQSGYAFSPQRDEPVQVRIRTAFDKLYEALQETEPKI